MAAMISGGGKFELDDDQLQSILFSRPSCTRSGERSFGTEAAQ
jgi:hypothetical protein